MLCFVAFILELWRVVIGKCRGDIVNVTSFFHTLGAVQLATMATT